MPRISSAPWVALLSAGLLTACGGGDKGAAGHVQAPSRDRATAATASTTTVVPTAQRHKWEGAGWAAYAFLPKADSPLVTALYDTHGGSSATQFVDGTPQYSGIGADGSKQHPWRTLAQAIAAMKNAHSETLLLKCGSVFEDLISKGVAAFADDITALRIGMYPDAAHPCNESTRPVISGSKEVTGNWTNVPGKPGVYAQSGTATAKGLFYKNASGQEVPLRLARFPNYAEVGGGYGAAIAANENSTTAAANKISFRLSSDDAAAVGSNSLVNATVYLRTTPWALVRAKVQTYDATSRLVTLSAALKDPVLTNTGYYFEGQSWMMDAAGEWFHAGTELTVRLPDSTAPLPGSLRAAVHDDGIQLFNIGKPIEVEGIRTEHQAKNGFNIVNEKPVTLRAVVSVFAGESGIGIGASESKVSESHVIGPGNIGIRVQGFNNEVSGNVIGDVGRYFDSTVGDYGASRGVLGLRAEGVGSADKDSNHNTSGNTIAGNIVRHTAGVGISFANGPGVTVTGNSVISPCMRFADCGAIYTFNTQDSTLATVPPATPAWAQVSDNLIVGVAPTNTDGLAVKHRNQNVGIYLDELTNRVTIDNNEVVVAETGIYLHKARFNTITNNWVKGVSHASFKASSTNLNTDHATPVNLVTDNTITGNHFFSRRVQRLPPAGPVNTVDQFDKETVFAQLWTLLNVDQPADVFFTEEGGRNELGNNETVALTTSPNRWRQDVAGGTQAVVAQDTAAVWGVRVDKTEPSSSKFEFKGGLTDWIMWSGSALDHETSTIRYQAYRHDPLGAEHISNGYLTDGTTLSFWTNLGGSATRLPAGGVCGSTDACAQVIASTNSDALQSSRFRLDKTKLYLMRYNVKAGAVAAKHRSSIQRIDGDHALKGLVVPAMEVPANKSRNLEILFRPTGEWDEEAAFLFQGNDGTISGSTTQPPAYMQRVSLTQVSNYQFLPATSELALYLVNVSTKPTSLSCEDVGLQGRCAVQNDIGDTVDWSTFKLFGRSALTLFQRDAWPRLP